MKSNSVQTVTFSHIITLLRYPLTFLVIVLHCNFVFFAASNGHTPPNLVSEICKYFPDIIGNVCVPMFFLISGYLFFIKKDDSKWTFFRKQWMKRKDSLLLPYILWNTLAIVITIVVVHFNPSKSYSVLDYLKGYIAFNGSYNPIDFPLWYVRDLIVLVIISPLIYLILKLPKCILILLGALLIVCGTLIFNIQEKICTAIICYSLGSWFAIKRIDPCEGIIGLKHLHLYTLICGAMYVGLYIASINLPDFLHFFMVIYKIVGCFLVMLISVSILRRHSVNIPKVMISSSFFIYCFHGLFSGYLGLLILKFIPLHSTAVWLIVLFGWSIIYPLLCTLVYYICSKIFPRFTSLLSGGRG